MLSKIGGGGRHDISHPIFKSAKKYERCCTIYVPGAEMAAYVDIDIDKEELFNAQC